MGNNSFPELNLNVRRSIFWLLTVLFVGYSYLVYDPGTDYGKGAEYYTESAQRGKLVFQEYNCISCHQIYGLGGYMGPDLTDVMTSEGKGRPYAGTFIRSGTAKMPKFGISDGDLTDLLDYLEYVGQAGHYPVIGVETTWYGNIRPKPATDE